MKTITVRDIRQRWPEAERSLAIEGEITITRDGKPVARLLPVEPVEDNRPRFDPVANRKRREKLWGKGAVIDSLSGLLEDREDRKLL
jgi:antitoxin (DNA-binding transcriptional repressor) of toxin-antitoxin stability system